METNKEIMQTFYNYAKSKDYIEKVVGDYALRNKKGKLIRFISGKGGKIIVWEQGVGRYKI